MAALAATDTRDGFIAELERLQQDLPTPDSAFDQRVFQTGVQMEIRGLLSEARKESD
jgi:hypothetical protein